MTQQPPAPNTDAQRAAMKKLSFLAGSWTGEARILRTKDQTVVLDQTEHAEFKLDGLILEIEGVGRSKSDGKLALQALGLVSFDDGTGKYTMRAFNDGRWLECEVTLVEDGKGFRWGFSLGDISTHSVQRINEKGECAEATDIVIGSQEPRRFMEVTVRPQK
jgi:hypothetical protein